MVGLDCARWLRALVSRRIHLATRKPCKKNIRMNKFFLNVLATIAAAAIVGNVAVLWKMESRLTAIETKLTLQHATASTP